MTAELERMAEEQAALRRVATLVAERRDGTGARGRRRARARRSLPSQAASVLRWDGDTIRVIGDWRADRGAMQAVGRVYAFGGDTITARVVESAAPARHRLAADMRTEFGKQRWTELGYEASIGAPIFVEGNVWGVVTASRTRPGDTFSAGRRAAARRLRGARRAVDRQRGGAARDGGARRGAVRAPAHRDARRRRQAAGRGRRRGHLRRRQAVRRDERDARPLGGRPGRGRRRRRLERAATRRRSSPGTAYHPGHESATIRVLETGFASRSDDPPELEARLLDDRRAA